MNKTQKLNENKQNYKGIHEKKSKVYVYVRSFDYMHLNRVKTSLKNGIVANYFKCKETINGGIDQKRSKFNV